MRAVLPADMAVLPVGGINVETKAAWRAVGAAGFGLGSALYRPGDTVDVVRERARALFAAC
jgi:2-dehydro-3-deoxyphosphogalactonate aldolase